MAQKLPLYKILISLITDVGLYTPKNSSYLTLFDLTDDYNICEGIFKKVIKIYFHGKNDTKTLEILGIKPLNYHFCNNNNYRKNKLYNYDDNYNNITNFEVNEKRYFVNKYKGQDKIESDYNENRFDSSNGEKIPLGLFDYSEIEDLNSPNSLICRKGDNKNHCNIKICKHNQFNSSYEERRNFSNEDCINHSNNGNMKNFNNFNNKNNNKIYPENNNYSNINNFKNIDIQQ